MSRQRPTWWMYVVAASFLALITFFYYMLIWGPGDLRGLHAVFEHGAMRVRVMRPDTPFAEAGLRAGDLILWVDGLPVRNAYDWTTVQANIVVGRPQEWLISRDGQQLALYFTHQRATWQNRLAHAYLIHVGLVFGCFLLGILIGFRRPGDTAARIGSWFIMTASMVFGLPIGWAVLWRQLPLAVQAFLWIPEISRFVIEAIFVSLFAVFPRRLFRARWPWFVVWVPVLSTLPWRISAFSSMISGHPANVPPWIFQAMNVRTMLYLVAGVVLLAVTYRRLADLNERRRVRVLMLGTAVSLSATIPVVWYLTFSGYELSPLYTLIISLFFPFTLACPLAFAYAILRHRVFDIQVIIRQGLQYALARGAVLGLVPAVGAILLLDLAINSRQPLADILKVRGWIYAGLSGLVLLSYWQRKPWLENLDRHFFRERYDAQRILREVVGEIREARSFERVAPRAVARIEAAIHPEFVSVMVREPNERQYCALASAPPGQAAPPLAAESKLVALARVLGKPLEVLLADSGWLSQRLPAEEIDFARQARIDLLVPIVSAPGRADAILALGIKRSEEPYTREDQELLESIAESLALLLDQPVPAPSVVSGTFDECPECGGCYDSGLGHCAAEGAGLVSMHLPRTLAGRYRLERRLGRGGMGTVYEATDRSLERRVAVKVIREDWVGSEEAAQRFQREARAAAGFAHANVVTVHDYGVEAGRRAFLVMELLKGVTLRDELKRRTRLEPSRTVGIFRGVCAAVEAAHHRQLIHRDLKPENIFLARSEGADRAGETVKVLDFGIAKFLPSSADAAVTRTDFETNPGILVGTVAYLSPEQLLGESPAVSWDLWALAVVVYETLTGALPFKPVPVEDWKSAVLSCRFTPLTEYLKDPPSQWQTFFASCFAANRAERPRSAEEFLHNLESATGHSSSKFVTSGLDTSEFHD
jgi:tRNA A-37 threonylcarbamoyl transferase component Bud32